MMPEERELSSILSDISYCSLCGGNRPLYIYFFLGVGLYMAVSALGAMNLQRYTLTCHYTVLTVGIYPLKS